MSFSEWKEVKIGEYVETISKTHKFNKEQLIFLNTSDILDGKILRREYSNVSEMPGQAKKSIQIDDILYSEIRPKNKRYAYINFEADDYIVSTKLMVLRKKSNQLDSKFLYKLLTSNDMLETLQTIAEGRSGTFPQITFSQLADLKIKLPPLDEQNAIASILSALDDKIDLNNRINKTLEEMSQAIFKSWFVDFEPFKDGEFEDSELGMIPKGWSVGVLGDIIELFDSKRIPLSSRQRESLEKIYPYYGATSIMDYVDKYIFDGIYLLMGEDGSVIDENEYPYLQYVWGKFWVNNHAHVIKGKCGFSEEYVYTLLKKTNVRSIITGAVQLKINQTNLLNLKVLIPSVDNVERFNVIAGDIFAMFRKNIEENVRLTTIRDSLLPKLMSGEIRVPCVEVV